jgi:hypothetical protein
MTGEQTKPNPPYYEIQIAGRLGQERAEWLGLSFLVEQDQAGLPVTRLAGPIPDQAALFGILNRIRDLGLKLISVNRIDPVTNFSQNPE